MSVVYVDEAATGTKDARMISVVCWRTAGRVKSI